MKLRLLAVGLAAGLLFAESPDSAWGQPPKRPSRGNILDRIKALDKNGDGKITKAEATGPFSRMFPRVDANSDGVVDQAELKKMSERFRGRGPGAGRGPGSGGSSGGVAAGQAAPDFELKTVDGKKTVKLSSFAGKKPVALIFGSYT